MRSTWKIYHMDEPFIPRFFLSLFSLLWGRKSADVPPLLLLHRGKFFSIKRRREVGNIFIRLTCGLKRKHKEAVEKQDLSLVPEWDNYTPGDQSLNRYVP